MSNYLELPFESEAIDESELKIEKAIAFVQAAKNGDRFNVEECRIITSESNREIIIGFIEVPLGQQPINDIRFSEKIAVVFDLEDKFIPRVFTLREDFPKLLHLNLEGFEKPRSLCIYEKHYSELKLDWRAIQFIEDISNWLCLNAYNELHQNDQPLEPLLLVNEGTIVLPQDISSEIPLHVYCISKSAETVNLIASKNELGRPSDYPCMPILVVGIPQAHGILDKHPYNLKELHEFLNRAGIDLLKTLKTKFIQNKELAQNKLLIIAYLPKTTGKDNNVAGFDHYVFATSQSVEKIGEELNIWQKHNGELGEILMSELDIEKASNINIATLKPHLQFNKKQAVLFNGLDESQVDTQLTQIGLGALGSQIFMGLSRMGFGKWNLIDEDIFSPHNLARHYLNANRVGWPKSQAISLEANKLLNDPDHSKWFWENVLKPKKVDELEDILKSSELILDVSTSIAVERELVDPKYGAGRRITTFLNPAGNDIVILAEDQKREITIDVLEFQFYKGLIRNFSLYNHMSQGSETVRYSNSCRDISSKIPNDQITLLASVATNRIRKISTSHEPSIGLWRINESDFSIDNFNIPVTGVDVIESNGWKIIVDHDLIELLTNARLQKLPNETGGILIGGYDMQRKIIYIMDSILSPKDSHEYPTAYIRGIEGVEEKLNHIGQVTNGQLKYVGEWHSHPTGARLDRSEDDSRLFGWLKDEMEQLDLPPLMIIMGADRSYNLYIE